MTASYLDFPKTYCPNVSNPCWIPHSENIIHEDIIGTLPQCDTIEKYACMWTIMRKVTLNKINKQCVKSCKTESYKTIQTSNILEPFTGVSANTFKV